MKRYIILFLILIPMGCKEPKKICSPKHTRKFFTVKGLKCSSCEKTIEKSLEGPDISFVKVHFDKQINNFEICFDEKRSGFDQIKSELKEIGFDLEDNI